MPAVDARNKQSHRLIARPELNLLENALALLALAAFELIRHGNRLLFVDSLFFLDFPVDALSPYVGEHRFGLHEWELVCMKLILKQACLQTRIIQV